MLAVKESAREELLADKLRHFLSTIVFAIARATKRPEILHFPQEALFTLAVEPGDQGRFVGKHAATIWSIQTLFWYAGMAQAGYCYSVRLLGPPEPPRNRISTPIKFSPTWSRKIINNLITEIIGACIPTHADYSIEEIDETKANVTLTIQKYLQERMEEPSFPEAFATVLRTAGMSQGVAIKTETIFA